MALEAPDFFETSLPRGARGMRSKSEQKQDSPGETAATPRKAKRTKRATGQRQVEGVRRPRKSSRRSEFVEALARALAHRNIYETVSYENRNEDYLKSYMHQPLRSAIAGVLRERAPLLSEQALERKADEALYWEGDRRITINNVQFLGAQHRPDFVVALPNLRVAVEIKLAGVGSQVREGIGQSLVYTASGQFDFVIYILVDVTPDKKLKASTKAPREAIFIKRLWDSHNVKLVVC